MLAIGIDTSTSHGSVGLSGSAGRISQVELHSRSNHAERLLPAVERLLSDAGRRMDEIDLISVATGPGTFTGVRIGMATGKGLAFATQRPLAGFSTLESMALATARSMPEQSSTPICVVLLAGRGELYRGLFRCEGGRVISIEPEAAMTPGKAIERLPDRCVLVGDGVEQCAGEPGLRVQAGWILRAMTPVIGATLADRAIEAAARPGFQGFPAPQPNYLRLSDAEIQFRDP